jgi:NAD(P)-dependent dehydrogenase (short-subunit alcohol dehydrogenase family)
MKRLDQKVAIVTGGSKGIGKAFCLALAAEGAKVAIVARHGASDTVEKIKSAGGEALAITGDISNADDMQRMAKAVTSEFGRIDILVNNATISKLIKFKDMTFEDWRKVLAVNLDGLFLCTKAVYPYMMKQQYGRIINISSTAFFRGAPDAVEYVTTKGGIIGFTRGLATEAAEHGITVNCIAPGFTNTELTSDYPDKDMFKKVIEKQDIKRRGEPEDMVGALLFFASDESAFITGQTLVIDGGIIRN